MKNGKRRGRKEVVPEVIYKAPEILTPEQQQNLDAAFDILFEETSGRLKRQSSEHN